MLKAVASGAAASCCLKDKRPRRGAGALGVGLSGVGFPPCRGTQPAAPAASARRARLDCLKSAERSMDALEDSPYEDATSTEPCLLKSTGPPPFWASS